MNITVNIIVNIITCGHECADPVPGLGAGDVGGIGAVPEGLHHAWEGLSTRGRERERWFRRYDERTCSRFL